VPFFTGFLGARPMRFLGDISYSIYLCHLLVVIPVTYLLVFSTSFLSLPAIYRLAIAIGVTFPLVILSSYVLYRFVEVPSIKFGRRLIERAPAARERAVQP
jgi:peptidoglycan/LPS O-acetylase OafA/YrhL